MDQFFSLLDNHDIHTVDFCFTDLRGTWHHTAQHISSITPELLDEGVYFDGSSINGWRTIDQSDMVLKPDLDSATLDPFSVQPRMLVFCNVHDPVTGKKYNRDPRSIAHKAVDYLNQTGIADTANFGPEAEFFVFDSVRFDDRPTHTFYELRSEEQPSSSANEFPAGNAGHRPGMKGGYFPTGPVDSMADLRDEMLSTLDQMGLTVEKHHHEVAPSQGELGIKYDALLRSADNIQRYKYGVKNTAHAYGKTATFMPKPLVGDNGSGMHCHQSLFKDGTPLFAGDEYEGLSKIALHYIGGILKHARALNLFTNPTTNSYKRLVPGYEAPVLRAYSSRNRSAACRIPHSETKNGKRVEVRFPDPTANPYLCYAAQLMAGLDGIKHEIDPGQAMDKDLYALGGDELKKIPTLCASLEQAVEAVEADHDFLTQGDVFDADVIAAIIGLKREEITRLRSHPHPVEFRQYYSA